MAERGEGGGPVLSRALPERRRWAGAEGAIHAALLLAAGVAVLATVAIASVLFGNSLSFFTAVSPWTFYSGSVWSPDIRGLFGVLPLLVGTLVIAGGAALLGIPLGLGAALYLREYAPAWVRSIVKPVLEILAGVPTIVFGFFALVFVTPALQDWFGASYFNGLSAILVIAFLIVPLVSSLSEDALAAVPSDLREGALALGATRFEASVRVVLPAALSGIGASCLLAFSRAVGETMVVVIAAGVHTDLHADVLRPMTTLAGFVARRATGDLPTGSTLYQSLFAVGLTLFLMTLALNLVSDRLRARFREEYA